MATVSAPAATKTTATVRAVAVRVYFLHVISAVGKRLTSVSTSTGSRWIGTGRGPKLG